MGYAPKPRTAAQLSIEARAAAQISSTGYALAAYLPDHDNFGLTFDFAVNQIAINDPASFRSWNTGSDVGRTGGSSSRSGKLLPMSRRYDIEELAQLKLYGGGDDLLGNKAEEYARKLGASFAARVELARGQAIEFGTVTIAERDLSFTVDYGRVSGNTMTAPTVWTDIAADAIGDLDNAEAQYVLINGAPSGKTLISTTRLMALQRNTGIIKAFYGRGSDLPLRISQADVLSVLSDYGHNNVTAFDEVIGSTRVISANKVILAPSSATQSFDGGPLGTTDWGIPAEAINANYGIAKADAAGIFAGAFTSEDPEGMYVLASAIVLPVLTNANATLSLAV